MASIKHSITYDNQVNQVNQGLPDTDSGGGYWCSDCGAWVWGGFHSCLPKSSGVDYNIMPSIGLTPILDPTLLERIAGALERIADALEADD